MSCVRCAALPRAGSSLLVGIARNRPQRHPFSGATVRTSPLDTAKRCLLLCQKQGTRQHGWARAPAGRRRIFSDESAPPRPLVEPQTTAQNANDSVLHAAAKPPITPEADGWRTCPYQRASALPSPNWLDSAACGSTPPNVEISRCRRRVPASSLTPRGIRQCTSSGSGQATWQCPNRPPCTTTARHSRCSSHFPCVKLCSKLEWCAHTQFHLGIPTVMSFLLFLTGNLLM